MQNFNYHTHTYRCKHAQKDLTDEEIVKTFIRKGFKKICFTDHMPQKTKIDLRKNMRMDYSLKDEYLKSISELKRKYKGIIDIQSGFEIEYIKGYENELYELKNETDKLVLGQHFITDKNNNLKIFRYDDFDDEDLIKYANEIKECIELGIVSIVVHPDLYMLSRNSFKEVETTVAHIICSAAEKNNIPLEINLTEPFLYLKGKRNKVIYPSKQFWQIVSKYDIKVIYGIDVHYEEQITYYDKSINYTNELLGKNLIRKLKFVKNI